MLVFIFLQIWGASCFLLNKIFLAIAENQSDPRSLLIKAWLVYLLGVPAWEIFFIVDENWIAAAVQIGVVPSMLLGLASAWKNNRPPPDWLSRLSKKLVYIFSAFGLTYSLYSYQGLTALTQVFELMNMIGFLGGTYLLSMRNINGWLYFMPMNIGMGALMAIEENYIMAFQQVISLCFVVYGYYVAYKKLQL